MKAEISRFHSPDVDDLSDFDPPDPAEVGFLLQVLAGPVGTGGEESFDVQVCTPTWLTKRYGPGAVVPGRHMVLIAEFDWLAIEQHVRGIVKAVSGDDWREVALELDRRLGRWEFAEYTP